MEQEIDAALTAMQNRYTASPRHTIQVDFWNYMHEMEREMRQGAKRVERLNLEPTAGSRAVVQEA
jgi:hypothetical protein